MRTLIRFVLLGLFLVLGLSQTVGTSHAQLTKGTAILPPGQPMVFGKGVLAQQVINVPIDVNAHSIVPIPSNQTGWFLPNFRKLMSPPKTNVTRGVSTLPDFNQFPGAVFPQTPTLVPKK